MTTDLFSNTNTKIDIDIPDGSLCMYPQFFEKNEADEYFLSLMQAVVWKQEKISMYGTEYNVPRLSAWYGDEGKSYEYSGVYAEAMPWIPSLLSIKHKIESLTGENFNSVLLNQYRNGADGVAWHCDDERELGDDPVIASLSLGEERKFQLKHKMNKDLNKSFILPHGSLLLMGKKTQKNWFHQIPKSKKFMKPRINLTFRYVA